jgi:hypothetical protein
MRIVTFLLCPFSFCLNAQPNAPELSVVFVQDDGGRAMAGRYATPVAAQAWLSKPNTPAWTVEMHFTVSTEYPYAQHEIGRHRMWPLSPDTVRDGWQRHLRFSILDCWCTDQYLLVIRAEDTMRVDLPDAGDLRKALVLRVYSRSGMLPSPEVMRFRPGHFTFSELADVPDHHELELRLAKRWMAVKERNLRQQAAERRTRPTDIPP